MLNHELNDILGGILQVRCIESFNNAQQMKRYWYTLGFNSCLIFLLIYLDRKGHFQTFFTNALSVANECLTRDSTLKFPLISYGENSIARSRLMQPDHTYSRFTDKRDRTLIQGGVEDLSPFLYWGRARYINKIRGI